MDEALKLINRTYKGFIISFILLTALTLFPYTGNLGETLWGAVSASLILAAIIFFFHLTYYTLISKKSFRLANK